jgi:hypothetical protein
MADNKLKGEPCSLLQLCLDSPDFLKRKDQEEESRNKKAQTENCLGFLIWRSGRPAEEIKKALICMVFFKN